MVLCALLKRKVLKRREKVFNPHGYKDMFELIWTMLAEICGTRGATDLGKIFSGLVLGLRVLVPPVKSE